MLYNTVLQSNGFGNSHKYQFLPATGSVQGTRHTDQSPQAHTSFKYRDTGLRKLKMSSFIYIVVQVRLHLNVKLFNRIRMTGFVVRLFCLI